MLQQAAAFVLESIDPSKAFGINLFYLDNLPQSNIT